MASTITTDEVLSCANDIISQTRVIRTKLVSIRQCNSSLLVSLYEVLTGHGLPAKDKGVWSTSAINEAVRCQHVINAVSDLLPPDISLSHINGVDIAKCDLLGMKNLFDIFTILFNVPQDQLSSEDSYNQSYNETDSNIITEKGMQVINEVLEEELSPAHQSSSPLPPLIPVPFEAPPTLSTTSSQTDNVSDICVSLTTPPRYSCVLTTPLHSTPQQCLRSKKLSSETSNTPPLSISTLSGSSSAMGSHTPIPHTDHAPTTVIDHTHSLGTDHTPTVLPLQEKSPPNATPDTTNNELSKNDIIDRIVSNYKKGHPVKEKGHPVKKKGDTAKVTRKKSVKIKRQHYRNPVATDNDSHHSNIDDRHGHNELLSCVEMALPCIKLSPTTVRRYWNIEMNRMRAKMSCPTITNPVAKKANDIEKRHTTLVQLMKKDIHHSQRMHVLSEERIQRLALQSLVNNQRTASVRAKKYFKDYELAIRAKLQNRRTKEQKVFRDAYEECLKVIKDRVREMKKFTKEKQIMELGKYEIEIESMEKYYQDQLEMIADTIKEDQRYTKIRDKSQKQELYKTERELRKSMEKEISKLWAGLDNWEDDCIHFRQLDKDQLLV